MRALEQTKAAVRHGDLHPAPAETETFSGEAWSRDQVCHPQEEARWPCPDCGATGCRECDGGYLRRATSNCRGRMTPTTYIADWPEGGAVVWRLGTPAQRDGFDGALRYGLLP